MPHQLARVTVREMYHYLVNVDEYPEILPLAHDWVDGRLNAAGMRNDSLPAPATFSDAKDALSEVVRKLAESSSQFSRPWRATEDPTPRLIQHYFIQYMPTALVDGCWLQGGLKAALAHTQAGASLTRLYQHQVHAFAGNSERHFVADYRALYARMESPLEELSSYCFIDRADFRETSFLLPIFLLSVAQFTRSFCSEIFGLNLAWQFFGPLAFGPDLIGDTCTAYMLPQMGDNLEYPKHFDRGREIAREAAFRHLKSADESTLTEVWKRLLRGIHAGVEVWSEWFDRTCETAPTRPPDPRQEMIDMLRRKSPYGCGYHADRKLGTKKIDDHLNPKTFDGAALLTDLAGSPWVKPGEPNRSALLKRLIEFGGPMFSVFSATEIQTMKNWIASLPAEELQASAVDAKAAPENNPVPAGSTGRMNGCVAGHICKPADFRRRSRKIYRGSTVRELYHYLINVEFHPDILPLAERFARNRLERSMAMLCEGERPIPSPSYDPAVLERWVHAKHREQVESYRSPDQRPEVPKNAFIEATVQLAPLILIDGSWLQGIVSPALIQTTVGRMLFHVLVEELGEGKAAEHHANIYRDLLTAMEVDAPPVDTWEFARWSRLKDSSFDVPTLWLSISCFPRHFLPEILGLNLAVELAGVGGPYREARDTLQRFGYPTLFVDVHNAADNVSVGHAAWALNAIRRYMDETAEREGPHNLDYTWHRVWSGVRATLPQIGRIRLASHRIRKRLFGEDPALIPRIFPS
jgi:hypothetical protein